MREIKIGNSKIQTKSTPCKINGYQGPDYDSPYTNVQVVMTRHCNAKCAFCTYHDNTDETKFNIELFKRGLVEIRNKADIPVVTFTGGETTLELDILKECCDFVRKLDNNIRVKVNTNGRLLNELLDWDIWWISLSRHSVDNKENADIFGVKGLPTLEDLSKLSSKQMEKMHVSCNIIKGYVDTFDKMQDFVDKVGSTGIPDIGFVSLMGVNEYSREHSIDFKELDIHDTERWLLGQRCEYMKDNECICKCHTYSVLTKSNKLLVAYNRFVVDNTCNDSTIVYNINKWQQGFSGIGIEL